MTTMPRRRGQYISDRPAAAKARYVRYRENEAILALLAHDLISWRDEALVQGMIVNCLLDRLELLEGEQKELLGSLRRACARQLKRNAGVKRGL